MTSDVARVQLSNDSRLLFALVRFSSRGSSHLLVSDTSESTSTRSGSSFCFVVVLAYRSQLPRDPFLVELVDEQCFTYPVPAGGSHGPRIPGCTLVDVEFDGPHERVWVPEHKIENGVRWNAAWNSKKPRAALIKSEEDDEKKGERLQSEEWREREREKKKWRERRGWWAILATVVPRSHTPGEPKGVSLLTGSEFAEEVEEREGLCDW